MERFANYRVIVVSTPSDRQRLRDINFPVGQILVVDVNAENAADYDVDCAEGGVAWEADGLMILALEANGTVGHHGDLDGEDGAPGLGEVGLFELVDVVGEGFGGGVDGVAEGVGG